MNERINHDATILVVDDEESLSELVSSALRFAGYTVQTESNGFDALRNVKAATPDLIVLDVNMPEKNGFEVCETIRARNEWSHIRIIMLTAHGRDIEREKGLALGADDYVTKPFATQEVVSKVQEVLEQS